MAKYGVQLRDANGDSLYPRTIIEQIYNMAGSARLDVLLSTMRENLEGDIADTNLAVARLREDLNALLSNATLSGAVLDAIVEIKTLLDSNSSDVVEQLVTTMSALRDEAIRNVAQELTLSQKQQARTNVGAVGVKYTDNRGAHLEQAGTEIMPYTKAGNVEYRGSNLDAVVNVLDERSSETKEKVDVFLADADTSELAIDKLKELQDYIKSDETSASQMLGDIAQNKQDIADNAESLEKEATRAKQVEMYLESQKADKYGYYENLSVGVSDNLSGRGESTESEFVMRPSGGENKSIEDGTARINSIKGNSVVWNNIAKEFNNENWFVFNGDAQLYAEASFANKGVNITAIRPTNNEYQIGVYYDIENPLNSGHTYMCIFDAKFSKGINSGAVCLEYDGVNYATNYIQIKSDEWNNFAIVFTVPNSTAKRIYIKPHNGYRGGAIGDNWTLSNYELHDLTKMFNGVNVPTTVEEYEALYGNMPDEYNGGTIIDNHTSAIKSVGVNAWDEEWELGGMNVDTGEITNHNNLVRSKNFIPVIGGKTYYFGSSKNGINNFYLRVACYDIDKKYIGNIKNGVYTGTSINNVNYNNPFTFNTNVAYIKFDITPEYGVTYNHDICINLSDAYINGKYFPYESQTRQLPTVEGGLKSAGTACDEFRYNKSKDKWEHVKRIGSVDLGTLDWVLSPTQTEGVSRFYSTKIEDAVAVVTTEDKGNIICGKYIRVSPTDTYLLNKGVAINYDVPRLFIYDPAFTDVTTFKQAMQGVILNYELVTPIVTELDVDISSDYKVWDYGTEEAISKVLSTPVRINANYGFNAVGQITDNAELIKELLARVAVLEAQVAQANVEPIEPIVE